ncbi:small, acid-soluble spore protein, H family [Priestia megaterium]|uniref:Small, acid-soluble spore protein H n=1 Tax=Priestia megaterium TaxID=1404 RepID=A0A6H1P417_PRIMG|nr:H-type small acid-soluble spore protein [Priestia megaterium]QIZ08192.1 small, acid-soluble spore protein, H family [Priestia megaterium]
MKLNRVKEILFYDQEIAVHYHGIPVWIESVDETSNKAVVSERGVHSERQIVPINDLEETGEYYT